MYVTRHFFFGSPKRSKWIHFLDSEDNNLENLHVIIFSGILKYDGDSKGYLLLVGAVVC